MPDDGDLMAWVFVTYPQIDFIELGAIKIIYGAGSS